MGHNINQSHKSSIYVPYSGSSGILLMLVSIVVPEKLPGQKRCEVEEAEEEHEFWGVSDVFLK